MTDAVQETTDVTVLLVDDNPQNLKVLYETLKDRGYRLLIANGGGKALDLARRHTPEVILLDIMMPEIDGYQVCQMLKSDPVTADCAVVFLSALDDVDTKVRGFALGGADYISKPFQAQEVLARVQTHARVIRLERELQARNRQLENDQARILNSISEGIYGLDNEGRIVYANPAAAMIMRTSAEELIGRNFFEFHFGRSGQDLADLPAHATCCSGQPENQRNVELFRADGTRFPAEYCSTPKWDGDQFHGAVVVFRDITVELKNEQALEEARKLVQEQRDQLAHVSRMTTVGEMAAGVAHEVNQPLTAITNYSRVAQRLIAKDQPDIGLLSETLGKIEAQSHRASEVIRRIRRFMKKPAAGKEVLSLAALLEDTRRFAEVDIRNNDGGIEVFVADDVRNVCADPVQVQQVALNLIRNALEATRSAGSSEPVRVSVTMADSQFVRVDVVDSGAGVTEEDEAKLFLPFFTTKEEGMGIGLPTCRSLIQAQGGIIGYQRPEAGYGSGGASRGACFYFTLPVAAPGLDGAACGSSGA